MTDPQEIKNEEQEVPATHAEEMSAGDARIEEYKVGWQRAVADYQNLKKEMEDRRVEMFHWSEEKILTEFIPVYDNFKKAFAHHPELDGADEFHKKIQNWVNGIGFIKKQFEDVLKSHGIEEIPIVGAFNPEFHDAVAEEENELEHGVIVREVESGYTMNGKVIKVAKVVVSKGI